MHIDMFLHIRICVFIYIYLNKQLHTYLNRAYAFSYIIGIHLLKYTNINELA